MKQIKSCSVTFKRVLIFILLLSGIVKTTTALAVQEFAYYPNEKIKGVISNIFINRIQFGGNPIIQIIGDESKYNIIQDDRGINLFLNPKVKIGENIEIALIDAAGRVLDLLLKVANIEGQVIKINSSEFRLLNRCAQNSEDQELQHMLKYMIKGESNKYYVTQVNRVINQLRGENLQIVQDRIYHYGKNVGARLKVTNLNKNNKSWIELTESKFGRLFESERTMIVLGNNRLNSGQSIYVWIALREKKDD